jgi:anti-sigma regulatory factor (Ser/Thr protein kinase)
MTPLPAPVPFPAALLLRRWSLSSVGELRVLRSGLRVAVRDTELLDRMAVVATELATNALRHGRPPAVVQLLAEPGRLILDVSDPDVTGEPFFDTRRPLGQGGLGLRLVRTFAIDSGWYRTEVAKHIWASFGTLLI